MRMILGLDAPTSGQVRVDGKSYHELRETTPLCRSAVGRKSHHRRSKRSKPPQVVADSNGITRRRVSEVLDIAGLSDVAGRKVGTFSLGMNQRLGIAAALLR